MEMGSADFQENQFSDADKYLGHFIPEHFCELFCRTEIQRVPFSAKD
jgi:hypothetical protein